MPRCLFIQSTASWGHELACSSFRARYVAVAVADPPQVDGRMAELEARRDLSRTHMVVDMDAFYASVEERANPSLTGTPFAVSLRAAPLRASQPSGYPAGVLRVSSDAAG